MKALKRQKYSVQSRTRKKASVEGWLIKLWFSELCMERKIRDVFRDEISDIRSNRLNWRVWILL